MYRALSMCTVFGVEPTVRIHSFIHKRQTAISHCGRGRSQSKRSWENTRIIASTGLSARFQPA